MPRTSEVATSDDTRLELTPEMLRLSKKWLLVLLVLELSRDCQGSKPVMSPAETEIYIDEGDSLELICTSAKTMRFYYPIDVVGATETSPSHLTELPSSDEQKIIFRRSETVNGDTGWYGCADHDINVTPGTFDQPEVSWTYVYVRSNSTYLVESGFRTFQKGVSETVTIPCRPTSPHHKVKLTDIHDKEIQVGEKVSYDPRFGFTLKNITRNDGGIFFCVASEYYGPGIEVLPGYSQQSTFTLEVIPRI